MGTAAPAAALSASSVRVQRGGRLVAAVDALDVARGENLVLLGPNGAGKTSLLLALAMLLPAEGELRFGGRTATDRVAQRRRMAVVLQRPLLLDRSVLANVSLGLALRGVPRRERDLRAQAWLERFGVAHLAARQARTLSGGEAQRVSLARAFVLEPEILFLDEPFSALDAPTRQSVLADSMRILAETDTAAIVVTHDRDEAIGIADRVAVMLDGAIRQIGRPDEVFGAPADPDVAAFLGVETILSAAVLEVTDDGTRLRVGEQEITVTATPPDGERFPLVLIAPGEVILSREEAATSARNQFRGRVLRVEPIGRVTRVVLDCGFPLIAHVTRSSVRDLDLRPGTEIIASFKATAPQLLPHPGRTR
jgi:molybdopterin-binding protein